jgi:EpsI family protein
LLVPIGVALLWLLYRQVGRAAPALHGNRDGVGDGHGRGGASSYGSARALGVVCAAAVMLAFGPMVSRSMTFVSRNAEGHGSALALPGVEGCAAAGEWDAPWQPRLERPDFLGTGRFLCSGRPINVFVAGYRSGGQGREVVNETYQVVPKAWLAQPDDGGQRQGFEAAGGGTVEVNELQSSGSADALVWYWYGVGRRAAVTAIGVKLEQALGLLSLRGAGSSVFVVETPIVDSDLQSARDRLARAARALWPAH